MSDENKALIVTSDSSLAISEEIVDTSTMIPRTQVERLVSQLHRQLSDSSINLPLHLRQLLALDYSDELKDQIFSAYSVEAQKLNRYFGQEIEVLGMVLWEVLPYLSKPEKPEDPPIQRPGYCQVRILTSKEDQDGNWIVLRSSSMGITQSAYFTILSQGAWLFKHPIKFRFSQGNGGMHIMQKTGESLKELKDIIQRGKV